MYDPENEIFAQPIEMLRDLVNTVIAMDKKFELAAAGTLLSLNGYLLRFEFAALENVRFLTNSFKEADIGGFAVDRVVQPSDIKEFFRSLYDPDAMQGDQEDLAHVVIKRAKYANIVAKLKQENEAVIEENRKLDRRKYALTVYARGVYFMRSFLKKVESEDARLPDIRPAARIVRDFVDICRESRDHFLGMTTTRNSDEYLPYHLVNTLPHLARRWHRACAFARSTSRPRQGRALSRHWRHRPRPRAH